MVIVLLIAAISILGITSFTSASSPNAVWPSYADMMENLHHPFAWWRWVLGDISEVAFYKHEFASIGLLAGAGLAYWANRTGKAWQGFAICYGTGLWPWLITSSLLGLALSNLLWGWTIAAGDWQPTFVAFVSLPAAMVLLYGRGWRVAINGAIMGAVLVTPWCLLIVNWLCKPLGLPVVIGNVSGMAIASVLAFILCRWIPALVTTPSVHEASKDALQTSAEPTSKALTNYGIVWTLRRILADFSEAPFFGNELASLGLLLGALLAYALNPASPAYGSGWLLEMIAAQALASAIGVIVWRRQWIKFGWYPTYIPIVSVAPAAVLTLGGSFTVIALSATLGALIAPPLAAAISRRLPAWVHGYVGNVISMAISTVFILPIIGLFVGGA
ncbi:hypothetical protein NVV94_20595 [Pseudomonas sp. LS1212]|nr:hypothetical protein [Pseudomonas sp. LS1212]UVJ46613.1 hypothetical protein NVV94_20595 [Pseudomonas sp. LS1212]